MALSLPGRPRILVCECEPLVAVELHETLTQAGADVVGLATNIAAAKRAMDAHPHLDAAVLDWQFRDGTIQPIALALARRGVPFLFFTEYLREASQSWPAKRAIGKTRIGVLPTLLAALLMSNG